MSMINCPKCGKEISDKAAVCPSCGFIPTNQSLVTCSECGQAYEKNAEACPNCGCPNACEEKPKKHKKYVPVIIISVIAVLLVAVVIGAFQIQKAVYYSRMKDATDMIIESASDTEDAGNLIVSVWHNAIYETSDLKTDKFTMVKTKDGYNVFVDFDDALYNLFSDSEFSEDIGEIKADVKEITALMKKLKNPPKKYEDAYAQLKIFYEDYISFVTFVIGCDGSYDSFTEDFDNYDNKVSDDYLKMCIYFNIN